MTSALSALANASATFTVPALDSADNLVDPATGNVYAATVSVTHSLYLKAETIETRRLPGIDLIETIYEGYSISDLDDRIIVGTEGTIAFGGADAVDCKVTALALPYGKTGLLGSVLGAVLGVKIQLIANGQS